MKSPQILPALPLFLLGLITVVHGQSCTSGHLYCGYALENMGETARKISVRILTF